MRLITRQTADGESLAVVDGERWMDASDVLPGGAATMMTLVAGGDAALAALRDAARGATVGTRGRPLA